MQNQTQGRLAYNVPGAAEALGISRNKLLELVHSSKLRHVRVGKRILIPHTALEEFLDGRAEAA